MGNIVLLDELTINKIAAGEVIERPASVIKEMIENSIDAGAKHITIEIKNGGISFIRITDDGKGIAKDDVEMAFERHATSKIRSADDLDTVKSMGFRGEALASIAAIANVELVSKTEDEQIGTRIVVEGGNVQTLDEIGCSKGTTITVRNLFFNTPVRYKFLKKDFTESGYIEDIVIRIALIHPEVAIKFMNGGKGSIQTNGNGNLKDVIYTIYGKEIASNVINVDYTYEYMKITGVVGKANIARSNRSNQIFFVNKRYIKDKTLSAAVEQAFKGMLPIGKFAFLVLNIEMPAEKVDVNVHPAKLEVRFEEENIVFKAMFHAVKDSLLKEGFMTNKEKNDEIKEASKDAFKINNFEEAAKNTYSTNNEINKKLNDFMMERSTNKKREQQNSNKENVENDLNTTNQEEKDENSVLNNPIITSNQDMFEKLKSLQEELKSEVEKNPNLYLTDTYKKMEQKFNNIVEPIVKDGEVKIESKENEEEINEDIININNKNIDKNTDTMNQVDNGALTEEEMSQIEALESKMNKETNSETVNNYLNQGNDEDVKKVENIENTENNQNIENIEQSENNENIEKVENTESQEKTEKLEDKKEQKNENNVSEEEQKEKTEQNVEDKANTSKEEEKKTNKISFEQMYKELFGKEPYGGRIPVEQPKQNEDNFYTIDDKMEDKNVSIFEDNEQYNKLQYKFIGIVFNTYIILEIKDEMYIMDQHAAHERIMYEKVKKNFYQEGEKASQMLLLPDLITLTHKEMDIAKDNFDLFEKTGFVLEEFGENTIKLSGVPEICVDLNTEELFKETLDEINTVARTSKQEKEEKFIATVACKAAVKAHMVLTKEEVDSLMSKLLELPNPFTCPHGRPTVIKMSKYEIERKFARK